MATTASPGLVNPLGSISQSITSTATASPDTEPTIPITVTFLGGLAPLFANASTQTIYLPHPSTSDQATVSDLIAHLASTFLSPSAAPASKRAMFVPSDSDRTVRPGILVLVNEADWELLGEGEAALEKGDEVVFVSTLHGG